MFVRRYSVAAICGGGFLLAMAAAGFGQSNSKEIMALPQAQLIEILKNPAAPVFDKAKACQRLAVAGTKDAIPALAALLADETLNVYARFGLEGIPDPAANEALRSAAGKLQGRALVGVIDSLGQRKDAGAVELLKGLLAGADKPAASAAAGALGRIGTSEAAAILKEALGKPSPVKNCIGDGCLACAEGLAAGGREAEALAVYEAVAKAELPRHQRLAGLAGQFRLRKAEGKDLLLSLVRGPDDYLFALALGVAREMPDVTDALVGELEKLPPSRQALLLRALGDRKDRLPQAVVIGATKNASPAVREAAIRVLAKLGDASAVGVLLEAALGDGETAEVAREGLKQLPGQEADGAIAARLSGADAKARPVLFELAGARRIAAARDVIRQGLGDADPAIRLAAIAAMGQLVELADIELLTSRALGAADSPEKDAARGALKTAALRMADRDATAVRLADHLKTASGDDQSYLLDLLGKISGPKALEIVVAATKSDEPATKDNATRVLGDWVNADAAPALLAIAQSDPERKYQIRALRGYIRIARQLQLPDDARLAMFKTAMATATRKDEKQLSLDILTRVPTAASLEVATALLGERELKNHAADAAVKIATKLVVTDPKAVAIAMQKVIDARVGGLPGTRAQELLGQAQSRIK